MKNIIAACLLIIILFPVFVQGQNNQGCNLRVEGSIEEPSCIGGMDGAITLSVIGGAGPFTFHWNSGQETEAITDLMAGTYKVTVRDKEGCIAKVVFPIKAQEKELSLRVEQQKNSSGGKALLVRFPGNTNPSAIYIKKLSNGYYGPQTPYTGQSLATGTYLLEVFTASGCSVYERVTIEAN